jgi:hypothetical protein
VVAYRLLRSTSAFLQTKLEYRRPTPLILVIAYMTFCFPVYVVSAERVAQLRCLTIDVGVEETKLNSTVSHRILDYSDGVKRTMNWKFDFSPVTRDMMALLSG